MLTCVIASVEGKSVAKEHLPVNRKYIITLHNAIHSSHEACSFITLQITDVFHPHSLETIWLKLYIRSYFL